MQQVQRNLRDIDIAEKPARPQTLTPVPPSSPDPEVSEKATRRKFTAEYKQRILREADQCEPGNLGALVRREGLYSSHLTKWRRQREQAEREALAPKQRGRKPNDPLIRESENLRRQNEQLKKRLEQAEILIDLQKKFLPFWKSH